MLSHIAAEGALSLTTEGLVQKPREQQISANFNFCSKLAQILPIDLNVTALPWYFFNWIWALFSRNKLCKNIVGFLFESDGIREVTQKIIIVALLEWVNLESTTLAPATPLPWNTPTRNPTSSLKKNMAIPVEWGKEDRGDTWKKDTAFPLATFCQLR